MPLTTNTTWNVVTGATGYIGKYITKKLISLGEKVKSLTGHPDRVSPFGDQVPFFPFNFDKPTILTESLKGVRVLYNTYWIRYPYREMTFDTAIENTKILIDAARKAGVHRFIHISVTNPDENSPLVYFRGKGKLERLLRESGLSYAIIRPTVIFGREDILINNIAWLLRKFPFFAIPGSGEYRLQPVFVEDVADLCVKVASLKEDITIDAAGPDIFTYRELVYLIARKIGSKAKLIHVKPVVALMLSQFLGFVVRDVMLTRQELEGLMSGLLVSKEQPLGKRRFEDWLEENKSSIGSGYSSELKRHFNVR